MSVLDQKLRTALISSLVAVGSVLSSQVMAALTAEEPAELNAEARATVEKFQAETGGAAEVWASASAAQANPDITMVFSEKPLIIAATNGTERRQDRRDDRRDNRGDRRDTRQDCRDQEGLAGKDKRDCKQEDRQERRKGDDD
jgi:hypothetical protein